MAWVYPAVVLLVYASLTWNGFLIQPTLPDEYVVARCTLLSIAQRGTQGPRPATPSPAERRRQLCRQHLYVSLRSSCVPAFNNHTPRSSHTACFVYTTLPGDTWASVAAAKGIPLATLLSANPGSASALRLWQAINLPCTTSQPKSVQASTGMRHCSMGA